MKKLITLAVVGLFTLTTMAADHYPSVTIRSKSRFQIMVDGMRYFNDNTIHLDRIQRGMHTIRVYEKSYGFFGPRLRLVSTRNFFVRNSDIFITVDRSGFVDVDERGYGRRNGRGRDWDDRDRDRDWNNRDRDRDHDRDWDHK